MAFKQVNFAHLVKFNSATSSDFLNAYEQYVDSEIAAKNAEPKHKTFAPSSFRCPRISWFRLRGVQPDVIPSPDRTLNFTAELGTACHTIIQRNLQQSLKSDWIDVAAYLKELQPTYTYSVKQSGYETLIEIDSPPVRFACDGIVKWQGELYLLEIKTSEFSSFDELTDPKPQHVDQIKCYATLLGLRNVLVLYQDRQYGGMKCYEVHITDADVAMVNNRIADVLTAVDTNLAPAKLPKGDSWCTSSYCPYYKKCKEWG